MVQVNSVLFTFDVCFFSSSKYWLKICLSRECVNKSFAVFNKYGKTFSLNISFIRFHFLFPKISYEQLDRFSVSTKQSSSRAGVCGSHAKSVARSWFPFGFNDNENNFCHKACLHLLFVRIVNLIFVLFLFWFDFRQIPEECHFPRESEKNLPPKLASIMVWIQ